MDELVEALISQAKLISQQSELIAKLLDGRQKLHDEINVLRFKKELEKE